MNKGRGDPSPPQKAGNLVVKSYDNRSETAEIIGCTEERDMRMISRIHWPQDSPVPEITINEVGTPVSGCYLSFGFCANRTRIVSVRFGVERLRHIDIPDTVRELCDRCFRYCSNLRTVRFGARSQLERIGIEVFSPDASIEKITIPDSVCELGEGFCRAAGTVIFGVFSKIEQLGTEAFRSSSIVTIEIPASVREISHKCFYRCSHLRHVTFGRLSKLQWIGTLAFSKTSVEEMRIPDTVRELGDRCFEDVKTLHHVILGMSSQLEHIGSFCFAGTSMRSFSIPPTLISVGPAAFHCVCLTISDNRDMNWNFVTCGGLLLNKDATVCLASFSHVRMIVIPDSVKEINDLFCYQQTKLVCVHFGAHSQVQRIGPWAFCGTSISKIIIPDSVCELCARCFMDCLILKSVKFGECPRLEHVGECAFAGTGIEHIHIPCSVRQLSRQCFYRCMYLHSVNFAAASRLESIGSEVFAKTKLKAIVIPDTVREVSYRSFERCETLRRVTFRGSSILKRLRNRYFYHSCARGFKVPGHINITGGPHQWRRLFGIQSPKVVVLCVMGILWLFGDYGVRFLLVIIGIFWLLAELQPERSDLHYQPIFSHPSCMGSPGISLPALPM